jgi:hypothetical protein
LHDKQFTSNEDEDPYQHVQLFDEICGTFKLNAFTYDEMKLKLLGLTLTAKAKAWLLSHPAGTFDTWDKLCSVFLAHFYPERKSYIPRHKIINFTQRSGESLAKAYLRYVFYSMIGPIIIYHLVRVVG